MHRKAALSAGAVRGLKVPAPLPFSSLEEPSSGWARGRDPAPRGQPPPRRQERTGADKSAADPRGKGAGPALSSGAGAACPAAASCGAAAGGEARTQPAPYSAARIYIWRWEEPPRLSSGNRLCPRSQPRGAEADSAWRRDADLCSAAGTPQGPSPERGGVGSELSPRRCPPHAVPREALSGTRESCPPRRAKVGSPPGYLSSSILPRWNNRGLKCRVTGSEMKRLYSCHPAVGSE